MPCLYRRFPQPLRGGDPEKDICFYRGPSAFRRARPTGIRASASKDLTALYRAYEMLLDDPHLSEEVIGRIRSGQSAPSAVRDTVRALIARFEAMDDAYLRARAEDMRAVGRCILFHLGSHGEASEDPPERAVLLGRSMGLTCIARVPIERLAGLVCTGGSPLSHGVIVARALGIPAVIGTAGLIPDQCDGREIVLDGYRGRVILDPTPRCAPSSSASSGRRPS